MLRYIRSTIPTRSATRSCSSARCGSRRRCSTATSPIRSCPSASATTASRTATSARAATTATRSRPSTRGRPSCSWARTTPNLLRELDDPIRPDLRAAGTPRHQGSVYATRLATPALSLTPSLELARSRFSSDRLENTFFRTGGDALLNLQAQYAIDPQTTWAVGVRNLFDRTYALAHGFPEFGRTVFANLRMTF